MTDIPMLRADIQMVMTLAEGRRVILFQDPCNLSSRQLAVDAGALPLLQMLDGRHDIRDIQRELTRLGGGMIVPRADIESFLDALDRAFLLNSASFDREMSNQVAAFARLDSRPCAHAGTSYDPDPENLEGFIRQSEDRLPPLEWNPAELHALVVPHIDIRVAQDTYIDAYRHLKGRCYDLVLILGINHRPQDGLFSVSAKHYQTPFGEIPTDRDFVKELKENTPAGTLATSDFGHKIEHSIEFQALFLRYYLGETPIVPILCGSIHEFLQGGTDPFQDIRFRGFAESIRSLTQARGKALVIAGVDFSHVGRKFGDAMPAESILERAQANDRFLLDFLLAGDGRSLYSNAAATNDRYKVCGMPALVLLAELMAGKQGILLDYRIYREAATQSAVTYASALFTEKST